MKYRICSLVLITIPLFLPSSGCGPCVDPTPTTNCVAACKTLRGCDDCCATKHAGNPAAKGTCQSNCHDSSKYMSTSAENDDKFPETAYVCAECNSQADQSDSIDHNEPVVKKHTLRTSAKTLQTTPNPDLQTSCFDEDSVDEIFEQLPTFWNTPSNRQFVCSLSGDERIGLLDGVTNHNDLIQTLPEEEFNDLMAQLDAHVQAILDRIDQSSQAAYDYYYNLALETILYECVFADPLDDCL